MGVKRNSKGQFINIGDKYTVNAANSCWLWTGYIDEGGYGRVFNNNKTRLAHRVMYEMLKGPIPDGLDLDHLCRNRSCVNPDHLEPVTRTVNSHRGINTKLNLEQVQEIRKLNAEGVIYKDIAKLFGVHLTSISHIITRRTWKFA